MLDAWLGLLRHLAHAADTIGYLASALVLATFSMRSMRPLRAIAIVSNVMFIAYALAADLRPVLVLHALLLPMNVWRLFELRLEPPFEARTRAAPQERRDPSRAACGTSVRAIL